MCAAFVLVLFLVVVFACCCCQRYRYCLSLSFYTLNNCFLSTKGNFRRPIHFDGGADGECSSLIYLSLGFGEVGGDDMRNGRGTCNDLLKACYDVENK